MGLFKAIGRWAGAKVESFGNFIGSEKIAEAGRKLQESCAEQVAVEKSYDKASANINTTDRLNHILVSFSEGYLEQATAIENKCIRLAEEYFDSLIQMLERAPDLPRNAANLKALRNGKVKIRKDIAGEVKKPLAKRMSLDDVECLSILRMDAGNAKRDAMEGFAKKVIDGALEHVAEKVRESMEWQLGGLQEYLSDLLEEQEKTAWNLKGQFEKLNAGFRMEEEEREQGCIIPLATIDAIEEIRKILIV